MHIDSAVRSLREHPEIVVGDLSPIYESEAHTLTPQEQQPAYLNAVVEIRTVLSPERLLSECLEIERREGRNRREEERWGPRTLDIDILVMGELTIRTDELTIPHPRMGQRSFVLRPLSDIAPDLFVPEPYCATVTELVHRCRDRHEARLRHPPQR